MVPGVVTNKIDRKGVSAMKTCMCWIVASIVILMLPNLAISGDPAADAMKKGKSCLDEKDFISAIAAFTEAIR